MNLKELTLALFLIVGYKSFILAQNETDTNQIETTVRDYIEGWYTGDTLCMTRALHPKLVKRRIVTYNEFWELSFDGLVKLTGECKGCGLPVGEQVLDITIQDIFMNIASVKAVSASFIDYIQLARIDGRWYIINVLWEFLPNDSKS